MSWTVALPEVVLAVGVMAMLMLGVFRGNGATGLVAVLSSVLLLVVLGLSTMGENGIAFGGLFVENSFTGFVKVLILVASAVAIIMAMDFFRREGLERFEYPVLMLTATLGMLLMVSANDFIALYMGIELQSLSLYVLAAFRRDSLRSTEVGLKYFVLGALSSGMLLYGCSLIYGFSAHTGFEAVAEVLTGGETVPLGVAAGIVFVIAGLAFKVSAVPFHMWTPDVYEGAPTPITAFFAVAPKIAAMALFVRVLFGPFGHMVDVWQQVIVFISLASMIIGAFAAVAQTNIKRLMAYSSIGHIGYALVGLAAGTQAGVSGVLIYFAIYLFMNVGTFACILSMRRSGRMVEGIADLAGLSRSHPMMAAAMAAFMFSMAGVPPLAGFWGKLYVFQAAVGAQLYVLAVVGVLTSVVSCFYYIRIVKLMYFDDAAEALDRNIGSEMKAVLAVCSIVILLFILVPGPIAQPATAAAAALFGG
ncbi:MAG: NADH-quinone oxidoreductase subunit NuoN [Alphaproteobacteria bacterium]|nr:NADH-quinone oxidoreductase subunit NuoN [Alphaproteobacteria bacterium]